MGQHDRAVRPEQIVEPAIRAAGFDHGPKIAEPFYGIANGFGVLATDGDWLHDFARVVDAGHDNGQTMKIDPEIPHDRSPCSVD